ncbi:MAG: YigZ family protein [Christensenellaceae bacterium]|jgi:putative IMPACT (imprinted ancient) family translation regulator|nr:YigZ family protein [Christensenellaceae bacterium]
MNIISGKEYREKNSRFFGFFCRCNSLDEFKNFLTEIKKQHKSARHFVYAYVINQRESNLFDLLPLTEDDEDGLNPLQHFEKQSNAGEPSGCGQGLLSLLHFNKMQNAAVIVVRYFGGTLLGVGNLIRAYKTAAIQAMEQ